MGGCMSEKNKGNNDSNSSAMKNMQDNNNENNGKVKHKVGSIIRAPSDSDGTTTKKTMKRFNTPQPNIELKAPHIAAIF